MELDKNSEKKNLTCDVVEIKVCTMYVQYYFYLFVNSLKRK